MAHPARFERVPVFGGPPHWHYAANLGIARSTNRKNRVLRVPATTFVITHSPSRSNRRDGFSFSGESGTGRPSRSGCVQRYLVHPRLLSAEHLQKLLSHALSAKEWAADLCRRENCRLFLPRIWGSGVRISSGHICEPG